MLKLQEEPIIGARMLKELSLNTQQINGKAVLFSQKICSEINKLPSKFG